MIKQYKDLPLNIYRASAGSGKTHLLTGFYLKLLFVNDLMPETPSCEMKFTEVLAVTFTNKATAEMKGRIIEEINKLATEPQSSLYWDDIAPYYNNGGKASDAQTADNIIKKAKNLMVQILNEYSSFNISTIDSFFQKIVRSFARELNVPGNYDVELDADRVLDMALSNFLDKLDQQENPDLFNWMVNFSNKRMEDGMSWDFRKELLELAQKILSSEEYHSHSEAIRKFTDDKEAMRRYAKDLRDIQTGWRKKAVELGEVGKKAIETGGLKLADFSNGEKSAMSHFWKWAEGDEKLPTSTFIKWADNPSSWFAKKSPYANGLPPETTERIQVAMQQAVEHFTGTPYRNYKTAGVIRGHFFELGILANIDKELTEYCNEHNLMLLSSTTEMLSRLIQDDDAPFIYEKTGTRIHSYMIDEFQDTSGMQWGNFMPLVSNSIAEGYQNLIVGDVKQSIYRFRGGDWNLLDSGLNSFESRQHYDDSDSLRVNWRSQQNIVEFNNRFFPQLAQKLDAMIGSTRISGIYGDVQQQLSPKSADPKTKRGRMKIEFLHPTDEEGNPIDKPRAEELRNEAKRRLPEVIIELQRNGYKASDIAILCRWNKECKWVAEALLEYKHEHPDCPWCLDIISDEALVISARPTVQTIINLLRHLINPKSEILRVIAWSGFFQLDGLTPDESLERYFKLTEEESNFHPELAHRPLYELCEELISLLPADAARKDRPFLQAFRDVVLEYSSKQSSDLSGFLDWWDQSSKNRSISIPEGQNAILIMSVHKSKGLGVPAIVMPYATWGMDLDLSKPNLIWCEPKVEPFKQDILLPLALKKDLEDTIFRDDFVAEREKAVIDNINTAYVAFTRAKETMVLLCPPPSEKKGTDLKDWLAEFCSEQGDAEQLCWGDWLDEKAQIAADEEQRAHIGLQKKETPKQDTTKDETNHELPQISILHDPAKPDITAKERGTYIHLALQHIRTAQSAPKVISDLYLRGDIDPLVIKEPEMQKTISQLLSMPEMQQWFAPDMQVLNEMGMMDADGNQLRADRVVIAPDGRVTVIDYKTGSDHRGYRRQVVGYMQTLQAMGFKQVEGYLLFIKDKKIVQVKMLNRK